RREDQQHRDARLREIATDQIFIEMDGDRPQHRTGKGKEEPHVRTGPYGGPNEAHPTVLHNVEILLGCVHFYDHRTTAIPNRDPAGRRGGYEVSPRSHS